MEEKNKCAHTGFIGGCCLPGEEKMREDWNEYAGGIAIEDGVLSIEETADYWLAKMKAHESEEKSRIASRIEHMFANEPETYWAIKSIIYAP